MATINNAINNNPNNMSFTTITSPTLGTILTTATGTIACDTVNAYLQSLIRSTTLDAAAVLLFDMHVTATILELASSSTATIYISTDQSAGNASTFPSTLSFGGNTGQTAYTPFIRVPLLISDIQNVSNTLFNINIVNNSTNTMQLTAISGFIAVTYLPQGFRETV